MSGKEPTEESGPDRDHPLITGLSWALLGLAVAITFWGFVRWGFGGGRVEQLFKELNVRIPVLTETAMDLGAWGQLACGLAPLLLFGGLAVVLRGGGKLGCATLALVAACLYWASLTAAYTLPLHEVRHHIEQDQQIDPAEREALLERIDGLL